MTEIQTESQSESFDAPALPTTPKNQESVPRYMLNYVVIGFTFLLVGLVLGANLFGGSSVDETQITKIVEEAIANAGVGGGSDRFELVDDDPYLGPEDAPIVIVEFSDFRCSFCGRHFAQTLQPLMANYDGMIRYVFRDFAGLGPESVNASLAANCAYDQGMFWEYHAQLFENQQILGTDFYYQVATELELDSDAFAVCYEERQYDGEIAADRLDGQLGGVNGTPGFFINGIFVSGAQPYGLFEQIIERELKKAGIESPTAATT